jgi:hypothetical protein
MRINLNIPIEKHGIIKKKIYDLLTKGKEVSIETMLTELVMNTDVPETCNFRQEKGIKTRVTQIDITESKDLRIISCQERTKKQLGYFVSKHNILLSMILSKF